MARSSDLAWFKCSCGTAHELPAALSEVGDEAGPSTAVPVAGRGTWLVPRVWVAAHGLRVADVPALAIRHGWPRKEPDGG